LANIQNIPPKEKLRDSNPKINQNFQNLNTELTGHINSTAAHKAEDISYEGQMPVNDVKSAIDAVKTTLDQAIISGDSGPEATAARYSTPYDITYATLKDRVDATDLRHKNLRIVNVKDYGAVGGGIVDDSSAILEAIAALELQGGGALLLPDEKYYCTQVLQIKNTSIVIMGNDMQSTQLFFSGCNGIVFTSDNPFSHMIAIKNVSIITMDETQYVGASISFPTNTGSAWRNVLIENVTFAGAESVAAYNDGSNTSQTTSYRWKTSLQLNNCAVSVVRDVIVRTGDDLTLDATGVEITGSTTDVLLQNVKVYTATIAFSKEGLGEGLIIDDCMAINVKYAVVINRTASSQQGVYASITNCHFNYRVTGVVARYQPQINISHTLFYKQDDYTGGSDINLEYCDSSKLVNNTMMVNIGQGSANGIVLSNSNNCIINDNLIQERETGIWITPGTTGTNVDGNILRLNQTNMLDQGTGTVINTPRYSVTMVATPTGSSFNLGVPLPSGRFDIVPVAGFCTSASSDEDIIGFYDYDASTTTNAVFKLVKRNGTSFSGIPTRFTILLVQ